jgi:hypothetical protein
MRKLFATLLSLCLILAPMPVVHANEGASDSNEARYGRQILGISNGIMGGAILTKCRLGSLQPSILSYMAGGLTYIAGEIISGKKQSKNQKDQVDQLANLERNMTEGGDFQKAMVQAQIDNEKTNLDLIELRRKWLLATKIVYGTATALAALEIIMSLPPPVGLGKPDQAACTPLEASHSAITESVIMAYSSLQLTGGNLKGAAVTTAMSALSKFILNIRVGAKLSDKSIAILSTAYRRIGFFAAASALVVLIDKDLKKEEEKLRENIAKLETVKAQFDVADNSLIEGKALDGASSNSSVLEKHALKSLPEVEQVPKHCFSKTSSGLDYSEVGCKNPVKLARPNIDIEMNVPALVAGANTASDMAQALADGDMAKADLAAGSLVSMAGRIEKIQADLMKDLNKKLIAEGKKPIDIEAESKRQLASLNQGINQASPGSAQSNVADLKSGEAATSKTEEAIKAAAITNVKNNEQEVSAEAGIDLSDIAQDSFDADQNDNGKVASLSDSSNEFETNETEIAEDSGVSIFKQVSNRYFLNYTKIFKRKEIAPVPAPAQ